jgi:trimethylamine--corrinoid protein Co-methyltransferase
MSLANYPDQAAPTLRVLSDGQCEQLFLAALECLERVGILVNHTEARQLLTQAGARSEERRVFVPAHAIQDAIACTPREFTLWGRQPGRELQVTVERAYFGPGPTCTYFQDPFTGERRRARRGDAAMTGKVVDALPNLDYAMSLSLLDDVTPLLSPVYEFAEMIANTDKPILGWANNPETLADIYAIAAAAIGGERILQQQPCFAMVTTYESPLRLAEKPLANLLWAAERGIPCALLGGPTVGLESPVTGASGLVLQMASALTGLAVVQLKRRGAAIAVGGLPLPMDLRTARPSYGSPEMVLYVAAACDLARWLGLPFVGTAGASESKLVDAQAAVEIAPQILASVLSRAGLVHDVGFLDCADIGSLALLVLSDEVIAMARRIGRGIQVNRDTIMLELIAKVGPGGHFIAEPESAALCRREIWMPELGDRSPYVVWEKKGGLSMEQRIQARLEKILRTHVPPPMAQGAEQAIQEILERAEERIRITD